MGFESGDMIVHLKACNKNLLHYSAQSKETQLFNREYIV